MFQLPTNKDAAVQVLDHLRDMAEQNANPHRVRWLISQMWMQGLREFNMDYRTGVVNGRLRNKQSESGRLQMAYEILLPKFQGELGRLCRMDIRPATKRKGYGLDSMRKASAGRVILDYLTSQTDWEVMKVELFQQLLMYGTVGIGVWQRGAGLGPEGSDEAPEEPGMVDEATLDKRAGDERRESLVVPELIPIWELFPLPYNPDTRGQVEGYLRKRWVPLEWVKKRLGVRMPQDRSKLNIHKSPYGVRPDSPGQMGVLPIGTSEEVNRIEESTGKSKPKNTDVEYVLLEEYWFLQDERDRLARYVVKIGSAIVQQEPKNGEYERGVYCPIGIAKYYPLNGFYGRSFIEILIPVNSEQEEMAASLFQNVKDMDLFGMVGLPKSWGVPKDELLNRKKRRKMFFYDPDLSAPDAKEVVINPATTTDFPGKVMSYSESMLDKLANQSDMLKGDAPGRVDSQSGLQFLNEQASIPLSVPAKSVASAMCQIYKAILGAAESLLNEKTVLPLVSLDEGIMGLSVSRDRDTVKLDPVNFPTPAEVEIGVRDELPVSPTLETQKLTEALKLQLITPVEFRLECYRQNLEFPTANWAERESYRKAVMNCIFLFGDGQTPGEAVPSSWADLPDIHLMTVQAFIARPEFQFASEEVREAFMMLKQTYENMKGGYPQAMPMPEDAAAMAQAQQSGPGGAMMGLGAGGPPRPPMGM